MKIAVAGTGYVGLSMAVMCMGLPVGLRQFIRIVRCV